MKPLLFSFALLALLTPSILLAEETPTPGEKTGTVGNASCFDYYHFGSVQADIEGDIAETVPGVDIHFKGKLKNDNDYPVINGTLYLKVFQRNENTFKEGDGNDLVDQFPLKEKFTIPAKGEKEVTITWHVPEDAEGGEYYLATFFATEERYNLSGLSFTDDVIGNSVSFKVNSQQKNITLEKTKTTLNGQDHHFAAYPLHFKNDEKVEVKTTLTNPTDQNKVIQLTWEEYVWDGLRQENQKNKKYELIEVGANQSKELSYTINPNNHSVSYLTVTAKDQYSKSILDIRLVRDGVEETRINFPSITSFPLKAGETNTLFACAHSTNRPNVPGNILTLSLRDEDQNLIHEYKYEGDISGDMSGFKDDFTPEHTYNKFTLTATLQRNGAVVEEVTIPYDCQTINPDLCKTSFSNLSKTTKRGILFVITLSLIAFFAILISKLKNKSPRRFKVLFLALS